MIFSFIEAIDMAEVQSLSPIISLFEDDESRWQAVVSRNANADGFFVYAVRTTKIFCRPICKARLARRANVSFFATGVDAQEAGFRACKRCKPEVAGLMPEEVAVRKIRDFVQQRAEKKDDTEARLSLSQMAKQTGLSKWHFHRVFKKCVGVTPTEYLRVQRQGQQAQESLPDGETSWFDSLDMRSLECDFDFSSWDGSVAGSGLSSTETPPAAASRGSPFSIDDLLVWPEERNEPPE
ncbi:HTH araC/xylS-type domain-containing protein [Fusarium falciforme]|uniref:HTH araC/xylS-type domain-containing protein n=1 Tax=Fusarium falciforme TaxID=195108 RepID=UPI0023010006|nr:HTH araC/xylS-type domain-containing protein [Fusarium falciforme]WAO84459.1 HTH araC/xylS-type domain-containing protein [Fusarium falciforme]